MQSQDGLHPQDFGIGALFWQIPEAVIVADSTTGLIGLWNPAAEQIFGYSAAEVVGRDVDLIIPQRYRAAHHAGMARYHATGHGRIIDSRRAMELPAQRRGGEEITIELSLSPLAGPGQRRYVLAVIRDISQRKQAEIALRQQAQLLNLAQDAIIVRDLDTRRITFWNEGAERVLGWHWAEALGRDAEELLRLQLPRPRQQVEAELLREGRWSGEATVRHKDGSRRTVECRWALQAAEGDTPAAVLELLIDVGERKRSEEALQQAYEELMELDRYKDEFLSVISHELRTPLNFIMGFASLLEDELVGDLNDRQRDFVGKILNGADRMLLLVTDLLDFAKLQAGKFDMDPQPTPYGPLVQDVVATMAPLAQDKAIALTHDVQVDVLPYVDGPRVIQVLTNLLSNAIKFTPPGGRISLEAHIEGDELVTRVQDSGIGIAAQDIPRVFEKFKQLDMSTTRQAGGTGLGLSIAKALVEAHGGIIGVDSTPGAGSTFWFRLPLRREGADH